MKRAVVIAVAALVLAACGQSGEIGVMSMNMRYDNPEDGINGWANRRDRIAEMIRLQKPDLIGTQELLDNQLRDLDSLLPEYGHIGVGREDGLRKGEYSAVFYRKEQFEPVKSGWFWLSEKPDSVGSKGWDAACERIATWATLRDRSGAELFFINTHLDHMGQIARTEGVSLLLRRIDSLSNGRPVVLTGDFNAAPESDVIARVLASNKLFHTYDIAATRTGTEWSFSDFGQQPESERELIDYIFVSNNWSVDRYEILPDKINGKYLSDHAPVLARIFLKN